MDEDRLRLILVDLDAASKTRKGIVQGREQIGLHVGCTILLQSLYKFLSFARSHRRVGIEWIVITFEAKLFPSHDEIDVFGEPAD